ncbi:mechanosensitive ion channel family protein [soil metagenome]
MLTHLQPFKEIFVQFHLESLLRAVVIFIVGWILASFISKVLVRIGNSHLSAHQRLLVSKGSFYLIISIFLLAVMQELGFKLSVLLGTAGILTLAIGIAAQFSFANLISGVFLLIERPFEVGDSIVIDKYSGEVLTIDTLAIKILTAENALVRIPNETLIKSPIVNLSRFPIRRIEIAFAITYQEKLEAWRQKLLALAQQNPFCLGDPKPQVVVDTFGDSVVNLKLLLWVRNEDVIALKNSMQDAMFAGFLRQREAIPVVDAVSV